MDNHSKLADHSSPLPFPQRNKIHAPQSCDALVSMLTIGGDGDDSIFESPRINTPTRTTPTRNTRNKTTNSASGFARLLLELDLPENGGTSKNKKRHTKRTNALGDEREKRNSSMQLLKPQRKDSVEDYSHIESALNAVFDHIEAPECDEYHSDYVEYEESLRGGYDDLPEDSSITDADEGSAYSVPSVGAKWSSPSMTETLQKPTRKSSIGPHSPHRSAHSPRRSAHSRSTHSSTRRKKS
ncbi:unnamed protein product [Cylindrotheca closterium]|uniref:Uncharacterized protein n=1 Tax=Cylindrotheca closterium TaxID=2856 RepID=A0AAD2JLB0_9STRA|nr:unnamed protein product [Cylindrotheca closterium]